MLLDLDSLFNSTTSKAVFATAAELGPDAMRLMSTNLTTLIHDSKEYIKIRKTRIIDSVQYLYFKSAEIISNYSF